MLRRQNAHLESMQIFANEGVSYTIPSNILVFTFIELHYLAAVVNNNNWRQTLNNMKKMEKEHPGHPAMMKFSENSPLKHVLRSIWDKLQDKLPDDLCIKTSKELNHEVLLFSTPQVKIIIQGVERYEKAQYKKSLTSSKVSLKGKELKETVTLTKLPEIYKTLAPLIPELLAPITAAIPISQRISINGKGQNSDSKINSDRIVDWKLYGSNQPGKVAATIPVKMRYTADKLKEALDQHNFIVQIDFDKSERFSYIMVLLRPDDLQNEKLSELKKSISSAAEEFKSKLISKREDFSVFVNIIGNISQLFQLASKSYVSHMFKESKTFSLAAINCIDQYINSPKLSSDQVKQLKTKLAKAKLLLGSVFYSLNELDQAKTAFQESLTIHEEIYGKDNPKTYDVVKRLHKISTTPSDNEQGLALGKIS